MSEKITFKELVELIAEQSGQSQNSTSSFITEWVQIIESGLKESGSVSISGFGKFELRWMNERAGVHPQTGDEITIPGQNKIVFKPYKSLREDVNRPYASLKSKILETPPGKKSEEPAEKKPEESQIEEREIPERFIIPVPKLIERDKPESKPESDSAAKSEEPEDDGEDLLIERPVPKSAKAPEEEFSHFDPFSGDDLFKEEEGEIEDKSVAAPLKKPEKTTSAAGKKRSGGSDSMKWTIAAAAVIILMAMFIIFMLTRQSELPPESVTETRNEQAIDPAEQEAARADQTETETDTETRPEPEPDTAPEDEYPFELKPYSVQTGETLWSIAGSEMGNPYFWPVAYDLNQGQIPNPNIIAAASSLTIPADADPDQLSRAQQEQIAIGYLTVYRWMADNRPQDARYFLWAVGVYSIDILYSAETEVNADDWEFALSR
jgi:nucleoid DNA-binding protein